MPRDAHADSGTSATGGPGMGGNNTRWVGICTRAPKPWHPVWPTRRGFGRVGATLRAAGGDRPNPASSGLAANPPSHTTADEEESATWSRQPGSTPRVPAASRSPAGRAGARSRRCASAQTISASTAGGRLRTLQIPDWCGCSTEYVPIPTGDGWWSLVPIWDPAQTPNPLRRWEPAVPYWARNP
jgi:hypothetical protein